ncbi:hypothetical protein N7488_005894 [Penicillium malachiteum]|nr:hypothetical protein N7488_005894 [Penicillium malachiteum]
MWKYEAVPVHQSTIGPARRFPTSSPSSSRFQALPKLSTPASNGALLEADSDETRQRWVNWFSLRLGKELLPWLLLLIRGNFIGCSAVGLSMDATSEISNAGDIWEM